MIFSAPATLKERVEQLTNRRVYGSVPIFTDTSSYMAIHGGSVLRLDDNDYYVLGETREGRFGIDDEPKMWVKYAVDLTSGERKILKLVFHEQFSLKLGGFTVRCRRNPDKESRFLSLVAKQPHFMHGVTVTDPKGNNVRIIDFVRGPSLYHELQDLRMPHEQYYREVLPARMDKLIPCIEALAWVHRQGAHHGDVRSDHIFVDADTGDYTWIDFDYEVSFSDYDVWSMGSVVSYVVGNGQHTYHSVRNDPGHYPHLSSPLDEHDALLLEKHRIVNLEKLFPYLPRQLSDILLRFSAGAIAFYDSLESLCEDLRAVFPPSASANS